MAQVHTGSTSVRLAEETNWGEIPAGANPYTLQVNSISRLHPTVGTAVRSFISPDRMEEKGVISDIESGAEFTTDLTFDVVRKLFPAFLYSSWHGLNDLPVTAVASDGFSVAGGGALDEGLLVYVRNCRHSVNNGLKHVGSGSTATKIVVTESGLVTETAPNTAEISVCGVEGATGDIQISSDGEITSTILDFTTLGLRVGQMIYVGGKEDANKFATATNIGFARVVSITEHMLEIDKTEDPFTVDAGTGKKIQLFFGANTYVKPESEGGALKKTYTIEAEFQDEISQDNSGYRYVSGNLPNQVVINIPLTDKCTLDWSFTGKTARADSPTKIFSTTVEPLTRTAAVNSSTSVPRLLLKSGLSGTLATYLENLTITINNNATNTRAVGVFGAVFANPGNLAIELSGSAYLDSPNIAKAIFENESVSLDIAFCNSDGCMYVEMPQATLGDGSNTFNENGPVTIAITGRAFRDPVYNTNLSITLFPYLPLAQ